MRDTRKICIALFILVIAGLVCCFVYLKMIRSKIEHVYAVEVEVAQKNATDKENLMLKNLIDDVRPEIDKLTTRLIPSNGTVAFIDYIEALGRDAGANVSIDQVDKSPDALDPASVEDLRLSITTQGSWQQVYTFLMMLESLPYNTTLPTVALSQSLAGQSSDSKKPTTVARVWTGHFNLSVLKKK